MNIQCSNISSQKSGGAKAPPAPLPVRSLLIPHAKMLLVPIMFSFSLMGRLCSGGKCFDWSNVIFSAYFTLRGRDTHIDFLRSLGLVILLISETQTFWKSHNWTFLLHEFFFFTFFFAWIFSLGIFPFMNFFFGFFPIPHITFLMVRPLNTSAAHWGTLAFVNLFQKKNVSFITEPQDDFFCFIPPSLAAKHEFKYIGIGLLWDLGGGGY